MIDYGDSDEAGLFALLSDGPTAIVFFVLAIVFYFIAISNDADCQKKSCPAPTSAKLMHHECLCVTEAK